MRNPHDLTQEYSLALMRVSQIVSNEVVVKIAKEIDALHSSSITF